MKMFFSKMHGAGNDFILVDDSSGEWKRSPQRIAEICNRHLGVGGDGMIFLRKTPEDDCIRMDYYNSDGSAAAVCGNGLRCSASFAYRNGLSGGKRKMIFLAGGERLRAEIMDEEGASVKIELCVTEPFRKYRLPDAGTVYKGDVGVPHLVKVVPDTDAVDVGGEGRRLRFHERFLPDGVNVDFVSLPEKTDSPVVIRTYERGVEDETLACGTGCASAAAVLHRFFGFPEKLSILSRGGDILEIEIIKECNILKGVFLTGPAVTVFTGELTGRNLDFLT